MSLFPTLKRDERLCAYELNGRIGMNPTPVLLIAAHPPMKMGHADMGSVLSMAQLRVTLLATKLWFLNRLRVDDDGREARVLKYNAVHDSWNVIARHRW